MHETASRKKLNYLAHFSPLRFANLRARGEGRFPVYFGSPFRIGQKFRQLLENRVCRGTTTVLSRLSLARDRQAVFSVSAGSSHDRTPAQAHRNWQARRMISE